MYVSIQLYDWEIVKINEIGQKLNERFARATDSMGVLNELQKQAVAMFQEIGIRAQVDITPCLVGESPVVTLVERIKAKEFDHDEKGWEVKKAKERGEEILGLPNREES